MQVKLHQRLTKIAIALVIASCCSVPGVQAVAAGTQSALQNTSGWQVSESTGTILGTPPKIKLPGGPTSDDGLHVKVDIDRSGRPGGTTATTEGEKQFHIGDKVTVSWDINDVEGDTDDTGLTKKTLKWICYSDQNKANARVLKGDGTNGSESYTIVEADENCYIGLQIVPTTETGDPRVGTLVDMADLSTTAGGGSDSDDIPEGPVVDDNVNITIYDAADTTVNLLKDATVKLHTGHTYKAKLWKDINGNGKYDDGTDTDVTSQYDYMWVFTGQSATAATSGDSSVLNADLVIPATNAEATDILRSAGVDGVQGNSLAIKYKRK
ncbi:SinI family autotransporter-associated protein [Citrobacter amalonaticus]